MDKIKEYKEILKNRLKEIEEIEDIENLIYQNNFLLKHMIDNVYSEIAISKMEDLTCPTKVKIDNQLLQNILKIYNEEKIKELNFKKAALSHKIAEDKKMRNNY